MRRDNEFFPAEFNTLFFLGQPSRDIFSNTKQLLFSLRALEKGKKERKKTDKPKRGIFGKGLWIKVLAFLTAQDIHTQGWLSQGSISARKAPASPTRYH